MAKILKPEDYFFIVDSDHSIGPYFMISPLDMWPFTDDSEDMDTVVKKLINPHMKSSPVMESTYEVEQNLSESQISDKLKSLGFIEKTLDDMHDAIQEIGRD